MSWLLTYNELTPDQQRAFALGPDEPRAVIGGPGSGKTQILLHRAQYLSHRFHIQPNRFRIFVYTNVLKDYIQSAFSLLGLPEENILTIDHWRRLFFEEHIGRKLPWDYENKQPDFDAIREAVYNKVCSGSISLPLYDFVLVDEGQDLEIETFQLLKKISAHITVCMDSKQQIYERGSNEAEILHILGIKKRNVNLIDAFRVCPFLVEVAAQLISDPSEREAFKNQTRQPQTEKQPPLLYLAKNFEDETRMLYEMVRERLMKNEKIAILFPQNRQVFGYANSLTEAGIEVEVPNKRGGVKRFPAHDFSSDRPKLMAYPSVKGLTFDSVFMPRLTPNSFQRVSQERIQRLLFVALTRAVKWAYLSTDEAKPLPTIANRLLPLQDQGCFTVRNSQNASFAFPPKIDVSATSTNDDLDFL
ncbi:MAG: UvrD-helicase domain-containing protein [Candidatus Omnitrophota bacterium]